MQVSGLPGPLIRVRRVMCQRRSHHCPLPGAARRAEPPSPPARLTGTVAPSARRNRARFGPILARVRPSGSRRGGSLMAKERVRDVMTMSPTTLRADQTVTAAARLMEAENVGDVIVTENNTIRGVVTDRDIALRAVARGLDPKDTPLSENCSAEPVTVEPSTPLGKAADMMSEHSVRRLPVVDNGSLVGIVSLGALAVRQDPDSVLGQTSAAP